MIFGHLLTSTNYDDTQKRVTGGRNGFGAKLTNIFSKKFRVDTVCAGKKFSKEWTNNMLESTDAKITENIKGTDYTRIVYERDFERFGMKSLDSDVLSILKKRVMDATACSSKCVSVYLNGERLAMKTLKISLPVWMTKCKLINHLICSNVMQTGMAISRKIKDIYNKMSNRENQKYN